MIQVVQGFKLSTREAIDNRLVLTKAEMLGVNDNQMPDKYFAICKDDGKLYLYNKNAEVISIETGKYSVYNDATIRSITVNGVEIPVDADGNVALPIASDTQHGLVIAGKNISIDNGEISIDFNAIDDKSIPVSKINFEDVILVADNIPTFL